MEAGKVELAGQSTRRSTWSTPWSPPPTTECRDERGRRHRALRLPDLRLLLGHVHRQLDELPDRGARPVAARQRLDARDPRRPQARCSSRPATSSSTSRAATTSRTTTSVLPRSDRQLQGAFENAMTLDIAMGGSTNTVLHLLAAAHEAEVDFTMADIDRLSRRVPVLCKVAPAHADVHMEDVHRAGGIMAILGELDRARPAQPRTCRPCTRRPSATRSTAGTSCAPTSEAVRELLPRRARRRADPGRLQPGTPLGRRSTSTAPTAASATSSTPTRRTAAWPCCTATSPPTAAS